MPPHQQVRCDSRTPLRETPVAQWDEQSQFLVTGAPYLSLEQQLFGMYDRILVPTDGSDGTRGAVEHAIDLANTYDAALHAIYVVDTNVGIDASAAGALDALKQAGEDAIDEVAQRAEAAGVDTIEGVVAQGTPHQAILDYVDEYDVDLVVMGTHGRTGLDRYLLGSVTEKIVRLSDAPVLTVHMPAESSEESS
jgi:nucleotide-binding universal stress UspA family protein